MWLNTTGPIEVAEIDVKKPMRPRTFCCQKESHSTLIGLWVAMGAIAIVMMNYWHYSLKDVLHAQQESKKKGYEVKPKKTQSRFL